MFFFSLNSLHVSRHIVSVLLLIPEKMFMLSHVPLVQVLQNRKCLLCSSVKGAVTREVNKQNVNIVSSSLSLLLVTVIKSACIHVVKYHLWGN